MHAVTASISLLALGLSFASLASAIQFLGNGQQLPTKCPKAAIVPDLKLLQKNIASGPVRGKEVKTSGSHYVFITGLPYSGTTSVYGLVSTSPMASNLCSGHKNCCEGGPLLVDAGLLPSNQAYNPVYPQDWNEAVKVYQKYWNMSAPVLVEKSVGNIDRFPHIWKALKAKNVRASFIYVVRSACFYAHLDQTGSQWLPNMKQVIFQTHSLQKSGAPVLLVKYEEMIKDPYAVARQILDFVPDLKALDPSKNGLHDAPLVGKGMYQSERSSSLVEFIHNKAVFPVQCPGALTPEAGKIMEMLGYSKEWMDQVPWVPI